MEFSRNDRLSENALEHIPPVIVKSFSKADLTRKLKAILAPYLHSDEIETAWIDYFDLVLEPCGWMGVWYPSPESAESHECESGRNGACVVEVLNIDPREYSVEVELLQCPKSWKSPPAGTISVHLSEIYPIRDQENEHLNTDKTAEALDLYRYFYKHLWRPWDVDGSVENWPETVLQRRIDLLHDLVLRKGNCGIAKRLEQLASEAQMTRDELTDLEETAAELDGDDESADDMLAGRIGALYLRDKEIQREAEILEDPVLRQMTRTSKQLQRRKERGSLEPGIVVVWTGGTLKEMNELVSRLSAEGSVDVRVHLVGGVEHAADILVPGDTLVIASPGFHKTNGLCELGSGGKILGRPGTVTNYMEDQAETKQNDSCETLPGCTSPEHVAGNVAAEHVTGSCAAEHVTGSCAAEHVPRTADSDACVLCPDNVGDVFISVDGDFEIRDVVLDLVPTISIGILLTKGKLTMVNVLIKSGTTGLRLMEGTEVSLTNCKIIGCNKGIVHAADCTLNMYNTTVVDCPVEQELELVIKDVPNLDESMSRLKIPTGLPGNLKKNPLVKYMDFSGMTNLPSSTPKLELPPPAGRAERCLNVNSSQESEFEGGGMEAGDFNAGGEFNGGESMEEGSQVGSSFEDLNVE